MTLPGVKKSYYWVSIENAFCNFVERKPFVDISVKKHIEENYGDHCATGADSTQSVGLP